MPAEFDESLRGLQALIKSQKNADSKKSTLKRQTYRQIIKIKGHLQESLKLANERAKFSRAEQKELPPLPLDTLQVHCEKLLHAVLMLLKEQLTGPLRSLIAECYSLLYRAGRTRTMFDTLSRWVDILNDRKTDSHVRCAVLRCIEALFKAQGKNVSSYFQDVLTALGKQMRLSNIQVKRATVACIFEVINSCGYAGKHSHAAALKFLSTAAKDKSSEIRAIVGSALETLAMATNIFDSLTLDSLMAVAIRGVDDDSASVRLAYARAISTMISISILNPVDPESAKPVESRKLSLGAKKKVPMSFSLPSAVSYLCAQLKRCNTNKGKLGMAHAMIEVIRHPSTSHISMTKEMLSPLVSKLLSILDDNAKASSSDSSMDFLQALTSFMFRNAIVYGRAEHHLILISRTILRKLKPEKVDKLRDPQIVVLLSALSHTVTTLGDAAGGIGADIKIILSDLIVHPSRAIRLEAAACARSLMVAVPALGSKLLDELVQNMIENHGSLVTVAAAKTKRKKASKTDQIKLMQLLINLRGRSLAVAALLFAVPACSLGVPRSTVNQLLYLSTALLHHYNDETLVATAASACARAGWTLIIGIIALGPLTVRPHLQNIVSVLKEVCEPRSPHSLNASTPMHQLEVIATAMCALVRLLGSWPSLVTDDVESMEECVKCVLNIVSALSPPQQSLSNIANVNTKTISTSFMGGTSSKVKTKNVKSDIAFITLYATSLEACALLPRNEIFLRALPSVVQSSISAFVDGLCGQTSLLDVLPLLDSADVALQIGERKWPGIPRSRGEDIYHVNNADLLGEPVALSLDSGYKNLSLIEREFALINAMAWAVPIVANGAGKGNEIIAPRRSWRPVDCPPSPFAIQRHVDSAVGLFSTSFPALSPEARSQLLDGFKQSIKAVDGKSNTTTAFVLRNILSALLGASKALVAYGGGGKTSKSASKEQSSRAPWVVICKGLLVTALHSRDSLVRRSAAEAIGYMSMAITDMSFAKSVEKTLYATLKDKDSETSNDEDTKHFRAGAIFALACMRRRLGSMAHHSLVPDNFFYNQSRETSQPIRTWALHSFWLIVNSVGIGFEKYVKPTMALVDAHLLAGRISETSREREPFDEQINVGVMLCLGRLINSVVGGMGPELVAFAQTDRMQQLWACWEELKESKFEIIQEECLFYVEQVAMFFPQDKGLVGAMPWILQNLMNGSLLIKRKACNCIRRIVEREPKLVFAIAPYLFYTLDHSQSAMEIAPTVMTMGGFGSSTTMVGSHNIVPPLYASDALGLRQMRYQTSPRGRDPDASMSRHALVQDVREILLEIVGLDTSCTSESTCRWLEVLQHVIIGGSRDDEDSDDEDSDDPSSDSEKKKKEEKKATKQANAQFNTKSPYEKIAEVYQVPVELDFWPMDGMRWQSKNVALECLQKLLQLAQLSEFAEKHFNINAKGGRGVKNSKKEKKKKKKSSEVISADNGQKGFLIHRLRELVKLACVMSTASIDGGELYHIQTRGISLVGDIIEAFAGSKDIAEPEKSILQQYEAQINSALRPCFKKGSFPPLTIQACRSVSSLISLGISTDLAMSRRAVKTLLADIDLQNNVRPPKSEEHQEHITMCKLLARLTALGTLQISTIDPVLFEWQCCSTDADVMKSCKSTVSPDMRKALSKVLRDILPKLRNYWFTALRDYVSLRARGNASRAVGRRVAFRVPDSTLLEYNEDALQVVSIYEQFWPTLTVAAASFLGTDLWGDVKEEDGKASINDAEVPDDYSYSLILGVCLQCLAHSPTGDNIEIDSHKAIKCFTVLRWLFSEKYVNENRIPSDLAVEIISILGNGLGSIESGSEVMSTLAVELVSCLVSTGNLEWLKVCISDEEATGFVLCHTLIEYSARIIHHLLKTSDTSSPSIELPPMAGNSVAKSVEILDTVIQCIPDEALDQYRASVLKLIFILNAGLLRIDDTSSRVIVVALTQIVQTILKREMDADNGKGLAVLQDEAKDLYESLCSMLLEKLNEETNIGGQHIQSSCAYGAMQSNLLYLAQLCRNEFQPQILLNAVEVLRSSLDVTNPNSVIIGGLTCIQTFVTAETNLPSIHSIGVLSFANLMGMVGSEVLLLLSTVDNGETNDDVKAAALKVIVHSSLVSKEQKYADFAMEILAAFQDVDRSKVNRKLAARCALQLLKSGENRFKSAVQNLSAQLQRKLQDGLKSVM